LKKIKNIAIIAARGNSKRLPGKNVMLLGNKPLIAYSIEYAKENSFIDDVYVSTDCRKIKKVAQDYGAIVIDRPEEISGDFEPTISAMVHVLNSINQDIDNVVLLQPTNPLRPKFLLKKAFDLYLSRNIDSLFTVSKNHHKLGKVKNNRFVPFNYEIGQRSQDLEALFFENGLLYITKANLLLKNIIISENALPMEVNHVYSNVDIDTLDDIKYANFVLENYPNE
jgi:N-acylneuraminate cytidylyltransferase